MDFKPDYPDEYINNFNRVEKMIQDVTLRDEMSNFKIPITGQIIMKEFNLRPGREVGEIKNQIKDAIIDGLIQNNYDDAFKYLVKIKSKKIKN